MSKRTTSDITTVSNVKEPTSESAKTRRSARKRPKPSEEKIVPEKRMRLEVDEQQSPTKKPKKSSTKQHTNDRQLSGYNKKKILDHLQSYGTTAENFQEALMGFKICRDTATDFFQKHIQDAEEHVHQECESFSFRNITQWLNVFEKLHFDESCLYEPAVAVRGLNEMYPDPADLAGIDLRSAYTFIGNALLGNPQNDLDKPTAEFLAHEFNQLIEEANTEMGDKEARDMKCALEHCRLLPPENAESADDGGTKQSLDPLNIEPSIK